MEINDQEEEVVKPTVVEAQELLPEVGDKELSQEYQLMESEPVPVKNYVEDNRAFERSRMAAKLNDSEQLAQASKLSKIYNVPAFFVAENLDKFKDSYSDEQNNYDEVNLKSNRLVKWLEDPKNATIAKDDDLNNLAKVDGVRSLVTSYDDDNFISYGDELREAGGRGVKQLGVSIKSLAGMFGRGDAKELSVELANDFKAIRENEAKFQTEAMAEYNKVVEKEGGEFDKAFKSMVPNTEELVNMKPWEIPYYALRSGINTAKSAYELLDFFGKAVVFRPKQASIKAVESLPTSGIVIGAGAAASAAGFFSMGPAGAMYAGASAAGTTGAVFETGAWFQQALADRDLNPENSDDIYKALTDPQMSVDIRNEALRKGITLGVVDGVMQVFGGRFFKTSPKSAAKAAKSYAKKGPIGKIAGQIGAIENKAGSFTKATASEMASESLSEGASQAAAYLDLSKVDYGDVAFEGIISPFQSGAMSGVMALGAKARSDKFKTDTLDTIQERSEAEETLQTVKAMEEINNIASESTTQQLDSETFSELTQNTALGDTDKKVYFQRSQWDEFWESKGEDPSLMFEQLLGKDIAQGSTIEVGLKEFVQTFTGTDNYQPLLEIIRQRPDGMTVDDALTALKNLPSKVNELAQRAEEEITRQTQIKAETKQLRMKIQQQNAAIKGPSARQNAEVLSGIIESMAQDMKVSVGEISARFFGGIYNSDMSQENDSDKLYQDVDNSNENIIGESDDDIRGRIRQRQFSGPIQKIARSSEEAQGIVSEPISGTPKGRKFNDTVRRLAKKYANSRGLDYSQQAEYVNVDTERASRIADAYSAMEHNPSDPDVLAAYNALIEETLAQYKMMIESGLTVSVITQDMQAPYVASQDMLDDVANNNHIWLYPTDSGFGTLTDIQDNPLLGMSGEFIGDFQLTHNDIFRVVHDYFGHAKEGNGFRAKGEENAWQSHVMMYSKLAAKAMTSETRGQNSWLNFGPFGEKNRTANIQDTIFADQKVGLLPDWVMEEGLSGSNVIPFQKDFQTNKLFQSSTETPLLPPAPIFYSGLAKTIEEKMGKRATKEQVNAILSQAKKDEVDFLGIQDFVNLKEGMIEKQDLLDFIAANGLEVVPIERSSGGLTTIKSVEGVNLIYRDAVNENGRDYKLVVVADSSQIEFNEIERKELLSEPIVQRMLTDEVSSEKDSEADNYAYELREKKRRQGRDIYLPDELITYLENVEIEQENEEDGSETISFEFENGQPSNLELFSNDQIDEYVREFYDSNEGEELVYERVEEQYTSGESFYGIDKFVDPLTDTEIMFSTQDYNYKIYEVVEDPDGLMLFFEGDPEGMNVEEFKLRLRQALIDAKLIEVDPSIEKKDATITTTVSMNKQVGSSKWGSHTLPGGLNYREVLLTLPGLEGDFYNKVHFPSDRNSVVHLRLKDRVSEDGKKYLYAEEIQSDLHQKGRDVGYRGAASKGLSDLKKAYDQNIVDLDEVRNLVVELAERNNLFGYDDTYDASVGMLIERDFVEKHNLTDDKSSIKLIKRYKKLKNLDKKLEEKIQKIERDDERTVINAPYKQTDAWTSLAIKRLMRMAAEEGYDGIGWTPADVHINRWGTDRVAWRKVEDGWIVSAQEQIEGEADGIQIEALARSRGELKEDETKVKTQKKLLTVIKDILNRDRSENALIALTERVWTRMQVEDVGKTEPRKEGFLNFYNKTIPTVATKIAKSLGLKVSPVQTEGAPLSLSILFDDKAKQKMLSEGFTLFQDNNAWLEVRSDKLMKIFLTKNADASSVIHEAAHMYLEMVRSMAKEGNEAAQKRMSLITEEYGVPDEGPIPIHIHERFAREFEAYMMNPDSKPPARRYRKLFAHFATFLGDIYGSIKSFIAKMKDTENLDIKINKNVVDIFERMLVSQTEVDAASNNSPLPTFNNFLDKLPKSFADKYVAAQERAKEDAAVRVFRKLIIAAEKKKTKAYKDKLKATRIAVTQEVSQMPIYNMLSLMRNGKPLNGETVPEGMENLKINSNELRLLYPDAANLPIFKGIQRQNGLPLQIIAEAFGYKTPDDLIYELKMVPTRNDFINDKIDTTMGEWSNDMLYDERALQEEAEKQVNGLSRSAYIRMEYDFLAENNKGIVNEATRRVISQPIADKDMRRQAEIQIGKTTISNIKPFSYRNAEKRAAKEAGRMFAKNDYQAAFEAKERQLLYSYLYQYSNDAKDYIDKKNKDFKKFFKKDKDLAKSRDMNLIQGARAMLAAYGMGGAKEDPLSYVKSLKDYNEEAYSHITELMINLLKEPKPFDQMTFSEFNDMTDLMDSLWSLSRESKTIDSRGEKVLIDQAGMEIVESIEKNDKRVFAEKERKTISWLEKLKTDFLTVEARFSMYSFWINAKDGGKPGVARQYLYEPIELAEAEFKNLNTKFLRKYLNILKGFEKRITNISEIKAKEINWTFRTKAELIGALYHIGNPSNKRKLLLGYKWSEINPITGDLDTKKWDSFLNRMFADGTITKEDMDDVQAVWDLNEELKPMIQKANRKIFGFYFKEIKNQSFETPFGTYKGGYVPAALDKYAEPDIAMKAEFDSLVQGSLANNLPYTGGKGMTIERNEKYAGMLDLDPTRMAGHIRDVIKFSTMKPAVIDVFKMIKQKDLSERINKENPATIRTLIIPMLNRADKLSKNDKIPGTSAMISKVMSEIKKSAAMQLLAGSAQNILEQYGQYFASMVKTGPANTLRSTGKRVSGKIKNISLKALGKSHVINNENTYTMTIDQIKELDPVFASRHNDESYEIQREMENLFKIEQGKLPKVARARMNISKTAGNIAFIGQRVTQRIIDADAWTAAFNTAIEQGKTKEQAVIEARNTVDLSQFSRRAFDSSAALSNEMLAFFSMFLDYFSGLYNFQKSESAIALRSRDNNLGETTARLAMIYILLIGSASASTALVRRLLAGRFDLDDDDEYIDEFVDILITNPVKLYAAMVPVVGPALLAGFMRKHGKPYEGRLSASPAIEALASAAYVATEIANGDFFMNKNTGLMDVRTPLSTLGTLTGLPIGPLSKPINYVQKWNLGIVEPTGPIDAARGLVTGQ